MFKWIKTHGCNCHPLAEGTEKYILNVGDIWGGIVQSHPSETSPGKFYWESWYTVCDKKVSGQSGGPGGRNENMKWIEERIAAAINQIEWAKADDKRIIVDALWQKDEETGEFFQEPVP